MSRYSDIPIFRKTVKAYSRFGIHSNARSDRIAASDMSFVTNKRPGVAILELLIVIGIIGVTTGMVVPFYRDYQIRNDLNLATEQITQGLARARVLSQAAQSDSGWGFYVPAGILFKGATYADRDPIFDETYPMPSTITPSGLYEVAYSKIAGRPSATGAITLRTLNSEERTVFITVEKEAVAVVVNDTVFVCHCPGGNPNNCQTLKLSDAGAQSHLSNPSHNDYIGACAGASSSSAVSSSSAASSVSSVVSSVASSVQSSSAGGAGSSASSAASCQDRFTVASDGTISVTGDLSVRFDSLGAQFGYGNGGPTVPVTVSYRKKNSGSWKSLFGGDEINGTGGDTQTVTGFDDDDKVFVKFRAYYNNRGWLTYDNTVYSNGGDGSVKILRNGDPAPTIEASNGQESISTLLQPVTSNGLISIGQYDLLMIADFNHASCANCASADFQDGIVLVKFLAPSCS